MAKKRARQLPNPNDPYEEPFSEERLATIFQVSPAYPDRLLSRESSTLEFKEGFGWKSLPDYARTMAAFANTKGGYLVFGVKNRPHTLVGLKTTAFDELDPQQISSGLNELFSPEIGWRYTVVTVADKKFGVIYTYPSANKPVIAMKNAGDGAIVEGEIYYRYSGRTQKIRYSELRAILDEQRQRDFALWMQHFRKIAQVGVQNAAILDTVSGTVEGVTGKRFLIDEALLPKLNFIREGSFAETEGEPTLKLVGELVPLPSESIQPSREVTRKTAINTPDFIYSFLDGIEVDVPGEFLEQLCYESSAYLPIYYFIRASGSTIDQARRLLRGIRTTRPITQGKLIVRLQTDREKLPLQMTATASPASTKKAEFREQIIQRTLPEDIPVSELRYVLQAIRTLGPDEIDFAYLSPLLKKWFDAHYNDQEHRYLPDDLRKTICYLDWMIHGQDL